jgi:periplasmic copper chaperone A
MKRALLLLLATACATPEGTVRAGGITIDRGFAFAPPMTSEAAAYFTIVNRSGAPDTLRAITSPIAQAAMLHGQSSSGGMVQMHDMAAPVIGARDSLVLAPGGTHLMLMTLDHLPRPGDTISVTLEFARAGSLTVPLPVRAYGDAP